MNELDNKMKITIHTSVQSFDPSGTCTDEQLQQSIASFGIAAVAEMETAFPGSEVEHLAIDGDVAKSIEIEEYELEEYEDALYEAQRVIEGVYATGLFWA